MKIAFQTTEHSGRFPTYLVLHCLIRDWTIEKVYTGDSETLYVLHVSDTITAVWAAAYLTRSRYHIVDVTD